MEEQRITKGQKYDKILQKCREANAKNREKKKAQGLHQVTAWTYKNGVEDHKAVICYTDESLKKHFLERKTTFHLVWLKDKKGLELREVFEDGKYSVVCTSPASVTEPVKKSNQS